MPTYVYACSNCNRTFEAEQRITEAPLDTCECGSKGSVKRVIQPVGVMFRGAGFHINDYAPKPPASDPAPGCTGTPDACPACKPDPE
ncbi:MAG: zinc ribbon domain-containing protein [Fimbriimonas ginsengisoli]|uniref:Zinc ribbon domain-containing protein n=1 Tax=Fimbriimonas ginsengisoli TaxID=1005039 RepID=A0A931LWT9_FIMGI|nr:zinc ribbon domain-containing protein [Fimbriimonas ginsengisoli]